MTTLARERRKELEGTVRQARRAAEAGALKELEQLAVHHHEPWPNMTPEQRDLRNRLRAHGRQLGDKTRRASRNSVDYSPYCRVRLRTLAPHAFCALPRRERSPDRAD